MTLNRKFLLALSAAVTTFSPLSLATAPTLANTDSSTSLLARNQATAAAERLEPIAKLFSYPHEERTATTLYVNQLPVLTFLSSGEATDDNQTEAIAQQVSQELNTLTAQADFDAKKFSARWQAAGKYDLLYGNKTIVTLDDSVFLADRTGNNTQDALIAVNRIRRILGNAEPIAAIANAPKAQSTDAGVKVKRTMQGNASWYGPGFHGRRTASGEAFNQYALTAAHKTLPFGTRVRVTNLRNGRSVIVRINDRGPYAHGRIIDLSKGSAQQIGLVSSGVATVKLEVLN